MAIDRWMSARTVRSPMPRCGTECNRADTRYPVSLGRPVPSCLQTQNRERVDAVVTGIVKITLDGESAILTAGGMLYVLRGPVRRVEVVASSPACCLYAIHQQ